LYWEFFMFFLFTALYVVIPVDASVVIMQKKDYIYYTKCVLDLMHVADMTKIFFTGYYHEEKSKVMLSPSKIAKRYLTSYFFFDLLSCIHSFMLLIRYFVTVDTLVLLAVRTLVLLKMVRLGRWVDIAELFRQ
ncbi:potassium/sodium hyperpolarization-activated cyclic nucleotide-gated channel 2-like, partial [Anoplophora glabripennis]